MLGLILKDLFTLKKNLRTMMLIVLIFMGFFAFFNSQIEFAASFIIFFASILSLSAFSFDKYCSWDSFALTMPISRNKIVGARYLLVLLLVFVAAAMSLLLILLFAQFKEINPWQMMPSVYLMTALIIILLSVALPVIYKFGAERGRLLLIGLVLVPVMIIQGTANAGLALPYEQFFKLLAIFSLPFAFVCYGLSYHIAAKIYFNKEF